VKLLKEEMDVKSLDQLPEVGTRLAQLTRSPNLYAFIVQALKKQRLGSSVIVVYLGEE
jgi:hypothetical protein